LIEKGLKRSVGTPAPLKAIVFSALGLLVSFGLCGLDAHLYPGSEAGGSALALIGAAGFAISGIVLVVSVLVLLIALIVKVIPK